MYNGGLAEIVLQMQAETALRNLKRVEMSLRNMWRVALPMQAQIDAEQRSKRQEYVKSHMMVLGARRNVFVMWLRGEV